MKTLLLAIINLLLIAGMSAQDSTAPELKVWFECVQRGPYEGMAQAHIAYRYAGEFAVTPEDSRLFGDTTSGETVILNYPIEPVTHEAALLLNVGANKVITLKIILFKQLHVVTVWDDPSVKDCAWVLPDGTPTPLPTA